MNDILMAMEAMLTGIVFITIFVGFVLFLIIFYISAKDGAQKTSYIRPICDPVIIKDSIVKIKNNKAYYLENIINFYESKDSLVHTKEEKNLGLLIIKNYGNNAILDVTLKKIGYAVPSDGIENKLFSLSPNEEKILLLNLPLDLLNPMSLNKTKFTFKNSNKIMKTTKFVTIASSALSEQIEEKVKINAIVQL